MDGTRGIADHVPIVGREEPLRAARRTLAARSGARSLLVAGPAGVGKSRLALELVDDLTRRRAPVRIVRPTAAAGATPLGALASVLPLRGAPPERPAELLTDAAGALAGAIADGVLVVEDAHLLDAASAGALHLAVTAHGMRLVATVRTGEPVDDAVLALWKDGFAARIDLAPLDIDGTAALAASLLGEPLDGQGVADLHRASEGNPLFVRELLVAALGDDRLRRNGRLWRFTSRPRSSARLAELLGSRLGQLGVEEREAAEVLAVAGSLGVDALRAIVGETALSRLEQLHLVTVEGDADNDPGAVVAGRARRVTVRLAHPLYGELVLDAMGRLREMAVHRLLSERLQAMGARRRTDVLDVARWTLAGGGSAPASLLLAAARHAYFGGDDALAVELASAARTAGAGSPADVLAAQALVHRGRHEEAAEVLAGVLDRAVDDIDVAHAAGELSTIQFWSLADEAAAAATVAAAQARVAGEELRAELEGHRATFESMANRPADALARAEPLLARGGRVELQAAMAMAPTLTVAGRAEDAVALCERSVPLRLALGDDGAIPDAFKYEVARVLALGELGQVAEAGQVARTMYELARAGRSLPALAWASMMLGRAELLAGSLGAAESAFTEGAGLFAELREDGLRSWCLAGTLLVAAHRGDEAETLARRLELDAVPTTLVRAMQADLDRARAWATLVTGDADGARAALRDAVADADERGAHGMALVLLHDLARTGSGEAAPRLGPAHRAVQGALAEARARFVAAVATRDPVELDGCAAAFADLGCRLFAAESAGAAADAYRRAGEQRRASSSAAKATELLTTCDGAATPLVAVTPALAPLTSREREVALLAARGLPNRDIAARLSVSARTVENHLQRAYAKLGIDRRGDLGDALGAAPPA